MLVLILLLSINTRVAFCKIMSDGDVTTEKLFTQVFGVLNYMFQVEKNKTVQSDVAFNLYTKKNPQIPQVLVHDQASLLKISNFNFIYKTYFVIHGYTDHKDRGIIANLRNELTMSEDANVIVVDWRRLAGQIYFNAADNTLRVGEYVAQFLEFLERNSVDLNNVHLIGHSLGAQISGIAGGLLNGRIGRITGDKLGLDPAGPYFEFIYVRNTTESLEKSDAKFVDIIHTDGEEFGIMNPVGHADFYPNDGISPQPGCTDILSVVSCSHIRSVLFYTESIKPSRQFRARHCRVREIGKKCLKEEYVLMGHHLEATAMGVYYLETNPEPPFAKEE